jgi:hypothetical protein
MRLSFRDLVSLLGFVSLGLSLFSVPTPCASAPPAERRITPPSRVSSEGMSGGMKPPASLRLNLDGRDIITIYATGDVQVAEGLTPDQASREFWQKVGDLAPDFCRAQAAKAPN